MNNEQIIFPETSSNILMLSADTQIIYTYKSNMYKNFHVCNFNFEENQNLKPIYDRSENSDPKN